MTYDQFNLFCGSLPVTLHLVQWGNSDVWKVGDKTSGKVFAIGGWDNGDNPAFTFKTSALNYEFLKQQPGYRPAPYFANRGMKWIQAYAPPHDLEALQYYLKESYRLASLNLTKTKQRELGLNQD